MRATSLMSILETIFGRGQRPLRTPKKGRSRGQNLRKRDTRTFCVRENCDDIFIVVAQHNGGHSRALRPWDAWCARHRGGAAWRGWHLSRKREAGFQVMPAWRDPNPAHVDGMPFGWLSLLGYARGS